MPRLVAFGFCGPIYTVTQAQISLKKLERVSYGEEIQPHPSVRCRFQDAGHILGFAIVEIWLSGGERTQKLVFSDDIGQQEHPLMKNPALLEEADVLVIDLPMAIDCTKAWRRPSRNWNSSLTIPASQAR